MSPPRPPGAFSELREPVDIPVHVVGREEFPVRSNSNDPPPDPAEEFFVGQEHGADPLCHDKAGGGTF